MIGPISFSRALYGQRFFLLPYCILFFIGTFLFVYFPKTEIHEVLNAFHHPFWDKAMPYLTHLGDGLFVLFICLLFVFISFRKSLFLLVSFILSSLIAQFFKQIVFPDVMRPLAVFGDDSGLHFPLSIQEMNIYNSFPSGHASSIFCLCLGLSFLYGSKKMFLPFLFFLTAFLIAYTRVYLSQHFLNDIFAGSVIAVISVLLVYKFFYASLIGNKIPWIWEEKKIFSDKLKK